MGEVSIMEIILFTLGSVMSIAGFYIRELYGRIDKMHTKLQDHIVEDAKTYVTKAEVQTLKEDIREIIAPLNAKLDSLENYLRERRRETD